MKKLFTVPLMGFDTPEVESLPSYISRIAYIHKVSVGAIIRMVNDTIEGDNQTGKQHIKPEALLQPNQTTMKLSSILGLMTSQPLEQSTLIWLSKALGRSSLELVKNYRWCPECFSEMKSSDVDPHIKLKWHMSAIKFCPVHGTDFISKCQKCGCDQTGYDRKADFSTCQNCRADLSIRIVKPHEHHKHYSWEENGFDLIKLFEDMADIKYAMLPEDGVLTSIKSAFDFYWERDEEQSFYKLFGRDESIALMHKQLPVSLLKARRYAFKLGVSLYTLMSGRAAYETLVINPSELCLLPEGYASIRPKRNYDHCEKLRKINEFIKQHDSPSLKQVCEATGVSVGYVRYRYPSLAQKIADTYLDHQRQEHLRKMYYAQKVALSYFYDQKYGDEPKTKIAAYREVKRETGLSKGMIDQAVKRAYDAMHN